MTVPAPLPAPTVSLRTQSEDRARRAPRRMLSRVLVWVYLAWSLLPVAFAILMSFNAGKSRSQFDGFSLHWWYGSPFGDSSGSLFTDPVLLRAIGQTLLLTGLTVLIAVPLGTAAGIGLHRWRGPISAGANGLLLASYVLPELVVAVALLTLFSDVFTFVPLGTVTELVGLVTLQLCIPALLVRARLSALPPNLEEAAQDLGATPAQALWRVVIPNLTPTIIVSGALVCANVVDDFVMVSYLSGDSATEPLSVKLYSTARSVPTPELNAAVALLLALTALIVVVALVLARTISRTTSISSILEQF